MELSKEQEAARVHTLGSSEIAAVLGVNPWRSPWDVWASKSVPGGRGPLVPSGFAADAGELGHDMEPVLLRRYTRKHKQQAKLNADTFTHPDLPWMTATPDAFWLPDRDGIVELKNVGMHAAKFWDDGPPVYVTAQVQWQLMILRLDVGDIYPLIGGLPDSPVYRVRANRDLQGKIMEAALKFRDEYWLKDVPPPRGKLESASLYATKRFGEILGPIEENVDDPALVATLVKRAQLKDRIGEIEVALDLIDGEIKERIGERLGLAGQWGKVTWGQRRGRVDWKATAEAVNGGPVDEELADQLRGAPYRQLDVRLKKEIAAAVAAEGEI